MAEGEGPTIEVNRVNGVVGLRGPARVRDAAGTFTAGHGEGGLLEVAGTPGAGSTGNAQRARLVVESGNEQEFTHAQNARYVGTAGREVLEIGAPHPEGIPAHFRNFWARQGAGADVGIVRFDQAGIDGIAQVTMDGGANADRMVLVLPAGAAAQDLEFRDNPDGSITVGLQGTGNWVTYVNYEQITVVTDRGQHNLTARGAELIADNTALGQTTHDYGELHPAADIPGLPVNGRYR